MSHTFTAQFPLPGISRAQARQVFADPDFHAAVARRIPGSDLKLLHTGLDGGRYRMKREYNLDVDIHEFAKKLLRGAFRLQREDEWDLESLTCRSRFAPNLPAELACHTRLVGEDGQLTVHHDWDVKVRVPLVHQIIARHAEGEIRRFNACEIDIVQQELAARLAG